MSKKARVKEILERTFYGEIVKENDEGFKVNTHDLDGLQLIKLTDLSAETACDVSVRRSGTGLVILIEI